MHINNLSTLIRHMPDATSGIPPALSARQHISDLLSHIPNLPIVFRRMPYAISCKPLALVGMCNIYYVYVYVYVLQCCRPAAGQLQGCCRDAEDLLLPCWRGAAESPLDLTYRI